MKLKTLIDTAATNVQGKSELGRLLGNVRPNRIWEWESGARTCPLEMQVKLCRYARLTDEETLAHVREVAGEPTPKLHGVAASFVLALSAAAGVVATLGASLQALKTTMYIRSST